MPELRFVRRPHSEVEEADRVPGAQYHLSAAVTPVRERCSEDIAPEGARRHEVVVGVDTDVQRRDPKSDADVIC